MVECAGHKRPYRSSEADALTLTDFTFGLDIVLFVIPLIYATRSQHHVLARASYREGLRLRLEMHQVEQRLGIVKGLAGLTEHARALNGNDQPLQPKGQLVAHPVGCFGVAIHGTGGGTVHRCLTPGSRNR